jgi:hypothetical protein
LEGLKKIVQKMKAEIRQNKDRYEFDVLIASQTDDSGAHVSHIDDNGVRTDLKINEFGETAYFTIKYIDRFRIDDTIGLEGEKPLVYMIPNYGPVERAPNALLDEWESNTNKVLDKIEKYSIHGLS